MTVVMIVVRGGRSDARKLGVSKLDVDDTLMNSV